MNRAGTQRLETQRLILRKFRLEDAEDMFQNWASDPEVTKYLTWPAHPSIEVTKSLLAVWIPQYEDGGYFNWVIEDKEASKAIGNISVVTLHEETEAADMGYCLSRASWGQGIMPEALKAVMAYLFNIVGLNRIAACHDHNNPKSGRVMKKAGMEQEGIRHAAGRNNQGVCDEVWYAALRSKPDFLWRSQDIICKDSKDTLVYFPAKEGKFGKFECPCGNQCLYRTQSYATGLDDADPDWGSYDEGYTFAFNDPCFKKYRVVSYDKLRKEFMLQVKG